MIGKQNTEYTGKQSHRASGVLIYTLFSYNILAKNKLEEKI
jgi:hypothetical protein